MKNLKSIFVLVLFCFFFGLVKAQYTIYPMISAGYTYQNQNFGEIGGKLLFIKKDEVAYRVGGSAMLGMTHHKFVILPKIQADVLFNFRENVDLHHGFYYVVGAETTTKYFAPYLGFNILGILDFAGGYAFSYPNQMLNGKELKGLKLGITFHIPLEILK